MSSQYQKELVQMGRVLQQVERVCVLTGAGISAGSGLPTYRGIGGLYNDIEVEAGLPIEEILHERTLARDPALTWKYISQIGDACRRVTYNDAHSILSKWSKHFELTIVTQNIDGFHKDSGSHEVIELHGNLRELYCLECEAEFNFEIVAVNDLPPLCTKCGGLIRPRVVLFGEMLPLKALAQYQAALAKGFDVIMAIGTTAGFPYIQEPIIEFSRAGGTTIEINPDTTILSQHVSFRIPLSAAEALKCIDAFLDG